MTVNNQTPKARLAAALWEADKEDMDDRSDIAEDGFYVAHAKAVLAADPTLAADLALAAAVRRMPHYSSLHHSLDKSGDRWRVFLHSSDDTLRAGLYYTAIARDDPTAAIEEAKAAKGGTDD